jgi:hypothetical protein
MIPPWAVALDVLGFVPGGTQVGVAIPLPAKPKNRSCNRIRVPMSQQRSALGAVHRMRFFEIFGRKYVTYSHHIAPHNSLTMSCSAILSGP